MADFLADSGPRLALAALSFLKCLVILPRDPRLPDADASVLLDRRMCTMLLKNKAVAEPLFFFCITNAARTPSTDLERVALVDGACLAVAILNALKKGRHFCIRGFPSWTCPRCAIFNTGWRKIVKT